MAWKDKEFVRMLGWKSKIKPSQDDGTKAVLIEEAAEEAMETSRW